MTFNYTFQTKNIEIQNAFLAFLNEWNNDKSYILVKTSGSTGKPKTIQIKKKYIRVSAQKTLDFFNLKANQVANLCLSIDTIAGKMIVIRSIIGNLHLNIYAPNQLENMEACDFLALVPMQLNDLIVNKLNVLQNTKNILVGGASISLALEEKIKTNHLSVYQSFGMTETISHFAIRNVLKNELPLFETLENVTVNKDEANQLVLNYPEIGIHNLKTNDLIHWHSPTQFEWIGRSDFTINSGGIKIQLEQLEKLLEDFIQLPFFLFGVPDEILGQKLILVIEGTNDPIISLEKIKNLLPQYQNPKAIYFLSKFVRTKSDKVNRIETISLLNL